MQNAYDNILQTNISANDAALNRGFEPYRFECPCCGEEVHLAAPFSLQKAPHFRHVHGNNSVECENYFGLGSAVSFVRKKKGFHEVADIYYDNFKKLFFLRVKFTEEEIAHYESSDSCLEITGSAQRTPFKRVKINHTTFVSDTPSNFIIDTFSDRYYITIENGGKRVYEFMTIESIYFFKIQGDDDNYLAKRIRSSEDTCVIYTNTRYLVLSLNPIKLKVLQGVLAEDIERVLEIDSMRGMHFYGFEVCIKNIENEKAKKLMSLGYRLEDSESLIILWPPCIVRKGINYIKEDTVYIKSSFAFLPHGGNNLNADCMDSIGDGITKLSLTTPIRIARKNTEVQICRDYSHRGKVPIEVTQTYCDIFTVPESNDSYIAFDKDGTTCLIAGQRVYLSQGRIIKRYQNNVLKEIVMPKSKYAFSPDELLMDMEKYYRRYVSTIPEVTECSLFGRKYIEDNDSHWNAAIVDAIKEGKI